MRSNLKTALAARKMRQVELAAAIGISASTLSEFVHGRTELAPHLQERIAELLRADRAWLFSSVHHIPAPRPESGTALACTA